MQTENALWGQPTNGSNQSNLRTDAEYGFDNNSQNDVAATDSHNSPPTATSTFISQRWGALLCLSLTFIFIVVEIAVHSNMEFESTVVGVMHSKQYGKNGSYEPLGVDKQGELGLSLVISKYDAKLWCNKTNEIVKAVRNHALLNGTEALLWNQRGPFHLLTCEQLLQSLPTLRNNRYVDISGRNITDIMTENVTASDGRKFELQNLISLQRLAEKLTKLEQPHSHHLTVVVIGGSMTTGLVDGSNINNNTYNLAFPRKLEQFMRQQWPASSLKVINIAVGGADENYQLGRLDRVMELDPDIILVESAVNDQCDYDKQEERAEFVNRTSYSLLNLLMNFPQNPAVISVELFRTAYGKQSDANKHCRGHVQKTSGPQCYFCPQVSSMLLLLLLCIHHFHQIQAQRY